MVVVENMHENTYVIPLTNGIEGSHGSAFKVKTIWSDASVENIDVNACAIAYMGRRPEEDRLGERVYNSASV